MKKITFLVSVFCASFAVGCGKNDTQIIPPDNLEKVGEFYGGEVDDGVHVGYEFYKSQSPITRKSSGKAEVTIIAFNDFHGAVLEENEQTGLKRLGTYFKEKSKDGNTLILDQGDTWQGTLESNYEYGAIVQDVFNYSGVSLRTVGNHDFDWGVSHLIETNNRKLENDYIPCLAANVYNYEGNQNGTVQQRQIGKEYATFVLENGVKVGVVGVIGSDQITSIYSEFVKEVCFTNHIEKVKEISDYLRSKKECDIIIASCHEGSFNMTESGLDQISPQTNKRYADLVLGGHKHSQHSQMINDVLYVQGASDGRTIDSISVTYNFKKDKVTYDETYMQTFTSRQLQRDYSTIESTINTMVDEYLNNLEPISSEVLSTHFSPFTDTMTLSNLMSEAIYECVTGAGIDIDFAVCNGARNPFTSSSSVFTYRDLYRCFPFDNTILLATVSSNSAVQSIRLNSTYRGNPGKYPDVGVPNKIAVLDYVGLHQNCQRTYDYFPDIGEYEVFKLSDDEQPITYREILRNYLKSHPDKVFNESDYIKGVNPNILD